jgi:hypothetical protein
MPVHLLPESKLAHEQNVCQTRAMMSSTSKILIVSALVAFGILHVIGVTLIYQATAQHSIPDRTLAHSGDIEPRVSHGQAMAKFWLNYL